MILYRKATAEDIDALTRMRADMLSEEAAQDAALEARICENTRRYLDEGLAAGALVFWVAADAQEPVGMGGASFFSLPPNDWCPEGKTAYIGNMYVRPAHRRLGIAARLLSLLLEEAKNRGCERILLHTTERGRPLYEKFGFEPSPTAMACYPYLAKPAD